VDGRNPAPVDRWFIPLFIGFQPSKVVQDFFHPQYEHDSYLDRGFSTGFGGCLLDRANNYDHHDRATSECCRGFETWIEALILPFPSGLLGRVRL